LLLRLHAFDHCTLGNWVIEPLLLLLFEPRIDVRDIQVRPQNGGEVLLISIDYEIRATNNAFNLVYPFYLERTAIR